MKRALIFDFGNVLMKTRDYEPRHRWDDLLGLKRGTVEQIVHNETSWKLAQIGQFTPQEYWADVANKLKLTNKQVHQLALDFYSGDVLDMELVKWITTRRDEGFSIALLSNDSIELRNKLVNLNIDLLFDPLVISAEIGLMKPDSGAYHEVLNRLDRPASETIFIDDRAENITGAKQCGMHGVLYRDGINLDTVLRDLMYT